MSIRSLARESRSKYRSIVYHGRNSMVDMNLMMIGSTPLSPVTPKIVSEEVSYIDGDLDLSKIDGVTYFNPREITYTFVAVHDFDDETPVEKNMEVTLNSSAIYEWLYKSNDEYTMPGGYVITADEMYDYAYDEYKFIKVNVTDVQIAKAMFNGVWVDQLSVTFKMFPYLQSFRGDRIELATFVDRAVTSRGTQTLMIIFTNNRYYLNDQSLFTNDGLRLSATRWRYKIRIPYSGQIGMYIAAITTMNDVEYEIDTASGIRFLDNDYPGQTLTSRKGGYGYTTPTVDSSGYKWVTLTVNFVNEYTVEDKPWIYIEWGVIRNFALPDQSHYIMDAYTKATNAEMYVDYPGVLTPFSEPFELETKPINQIQIINNDFDGMYKFRYDSTTRRL